MFRREPGLLARPMHQFPQGDTPAKCTGHGWWHGRAIGCHPCDLSLASRCAHGLQMPQSILWSCTSRWRVGRSWKKRMTTKHLNACWGRVSWRKTSPSIASEPALVRRDSARSHTQAAPSSMARDTAGEADDHPRRASPAPPAHSDREPAAFCLAGGPAEQGHSEPLPTSAPEDGQSWAPPLPAAVLQAADDSANAAGTAEGILGDQDLAAGVESQGPASIWPPYQWHCSGGPGGRVGRGAWQRRCRRGSKRHKERVSCPISR